MQFYSLSPTAVLNRLESLRYCFVLKKGHFNSQGIKIGMSKSGLSNKASKNNIIKLFSLSLPEVLNRLECSNLHILSKK